jgi:hypothetical protein
VLYTQAAQTIIAEKTQSQPTTNGQNTQPPGAPTEASLQPSDTSQPTLTLTPTLTITLTMTLTSSVTVSPTLSTQDITLTLGNPGFVDNMDTDTNWFLYDDSHSRFWIEGGFMKLMAYKADYYEAWAISWPDLQNFYLEFTYITQEKCGNNDRYGMIARAPKATEGYIIAFTCDGRYSLRIWDGDKYTVLIDWTYGQHIKPGANQTNRMGLRAQEKKLAIYANGLLLEEIKNPTYSHGKFGPMVGAGTTSNFTVWLDKVVYWVLP